MKISNVFKCAIFYGTLLSNCLFADTFLEYFNQANIACDNYLNNRSNDWESPVNLFIQGFNDLNGKLQAIWRGLVGDGESLHAWNGVPSDKKKTSKKRDCPIALHTWLTGHVDVYTEGRYDTYIWRLGDGIFPENTKVTPSLYSTKKGQFKRQILSNVFHKRNLRECALYLNDKFCKPISNLLPAIFKKNKTFTQAQCAQLLTLYGDYENLDTGSPDETYNKQYHYDSTKDIVHKFFADYFYNFLTYDADTQAWLTQLIQNYQSPYGDTPGISQYNIDIALFLNNLIFKMKNEGPIQDFFLMNLLNVIVVECYKKDTEVLRPGQRYLDSYHLDFQSFNLAMKQVIPQGGRGSPALY